MSNIKGNERDLRKFQKFWENCFFLGVGKVNSPKLFIVVYVYYIKLKEVRKYLFD